MTSFSVETKYILAVLVNDWRSLFIQMLRPVLDQATTRFADCQFFKRKFLINYYMFIILNKSLNITGAVGNVNLL